MNSGDTDTATAGVGRTDAASAPWIYTLGHSNRSFADFYALLSGASIELLCDVRSIAGSRAHPQFNREILKESLAANGIAYVHLAALGGRRRPVPSSSNTFWENDGFRGYADYAWTPAFRQGLDELECLARHQHCAIMCAEAVWWRCHRRIVADYLLADGFTVYHILSAASPTPATPTPGVQRLPDGRLIYSQPSAPSSLSLF